MLRAKYTNLWVIGLLFLAGCAASETRITTPVRPGPAVNAPAYRNGDQWHYRVTRSNGNNEEIRIIYRNGKFETDNQSVFDSSIFANVYRVDTELKPIDFPLTSGKGWKYTYRATSRGGSTTWRDAVVKVIGPTAQPVKTTAGSFKAVEIERIESWAVERKSTYFYSPNTKSVVKLSAHNLGNNDRYELELLSYRAGR